MKRSDVLSGIALACCSFFIIACGDDSASGGAGGSGAAASDGGGGNEPTSGGGGSGVCTPGSEEPCYTGPASTEDVGQCVAGARICLEDGSAFGECQGEVIPATESCDTAPDDDCDGTDNEDCGEHLWSKRFGDADLEQGATYVAADDDGSALVLGNFGGSIHFGGTVLSSAGAADVFLTKLDASGLHLWSKRFGGTAADEGHSVTVDSTHAVIVTGAFNDSVDFGGGAVISAGGGDMFLAKLDSAGGHVWSKRFGDAMSQTGLDVTTDGADNIIVTGDFEGSIDFGGEALTSAGLRDVFVAKLAPGGAHVWSKRFGGVSDQRGLRVAVDTAGNVLVTGELIGDADFGGGTLSSPFSTNIFLAKLDASGNHLWSKAFGDAFEQIATGLATDASGNVYLTGTYGGSLDIGSGIPPLVAEGETEVFLAKFDSAGNAQWSKGFGTGSEQYGANLAVDGSGNVVLTGAMLGYATFGEEQLVSAGFSDIFVAKFDGAGEHIWSAIFGDENSQNQAFVAVDATGNVLLAGGIYGSVDFGGGALASAGGMDVFVAKLAP